MSKSSILAGLITISLVCSRNVEAQAGDKIQPGEMAGYLLVPVNKVPESFNAGYSMYVAAWPLLKTYPGQRFQSGLFGTWMFAQYDGAKPQNLYSDVEGGLGWWNDTRFATITPKFIMGGVAPNFIEWANGPGMGKGRDWNKPAGKYGVAQLSPWVLFPPDGLNLKQGTCGELWGYGYLPLPLATAKPTTDGQDSPTGDQCWTLFLNTRTFKGPVAFFTPYFWSRPAVTETRLRGLLLDSRPTNPNRAVQMETQYIPAVQATDAKGETYARVAPTTFPLNDGKETVAVHQITSYNKQALWDGVKAWFGGGAPASGAIDPAGAVIHEFGKGGGATWRVYANGTVKEKRVPLEWNAIGTPTALDSHTFGYRWDDAAMSKGGSQEQPLATLPEYFHLLNGEAGTKPKWVSVRAGDVPADTGLTQFQFERPRENRHEPYVTPEETTSCWKNPGPAAGPFKAELGDGSVVTYYWYRFADQPALLNADLSKEERERMQGLVEKLHRSWTKDREYLAAPAMGRLAEIDSALIVTPPKGMEVGYVPIATRQAGKE